MLFKDIYNKLERDIDSAVNDDYSMNVASSPIKKNGYYNWMERVSEWNVRYLYSYGHTDYKNNIHKEWNFYFNGNKFVVRVRVETWTAETDWQTQADETFQFNSNEVNKSVDHLMDKFVKKMNKIKAHNEKEILKEKSNNINKWW